MTCVNCLILTLECEWSQPHVPPTGLGVPQRPACETCRTAKTRCTRDLPSCSRCRNEGCPCLYVNRSRRTLKATTAASTRRPRTESSTISATIDPQTTYTSPYSRQTNRPRKDGPLHENAAADAARTATSSESLRLGDRLASRAELIRLTDAFFRHVYPELAMSFIHRGQLYRRLEEQTVSPLLLKCMAAASARFLGGGSMPYAADAEHPDGGLLPERWAREAKASIAQELDRFSISKLAGTLCIIHHEYCSGRIGSAWTWTSLATRMCIGMSLHTEPPPDAAVDWLERETRRRLVWATVCADAWGACGLSECTTFDPRTNEGCLPSNLIGWLKSWPADTPDETLQRELENTRCGAREERHAPGACP